MKRSSMLVSNLEFGDSAIFGDTFVYIYLKNGFSKTCFRQSAKGKMTALNVR